ncbi:LAMI_0F11122g1_1 [Lachancea mirantina]|uniref:Large ribosomal subunit protein mL50 n=1 Tax=Lachancea mirantina TaxID=1230905 RepID=A0A1G4K2H3_9SACH|nr:LAMI_0F11122g1_1 [Lachancea mirantina]
MLALHSGSHTCKRHMHTSFVRQDFMSWFKRKQAKQATAPVRDTAEVISEIEAGKDQEGTPDKGKLRLTDNDFVGTETAQHDRIQRAKLVQDVPFNKWLSGEKVKDERTLKQILIEVHNASTDAAHKINTIEDPAAQTAFQDLTSKFHFSKQVQARTGIMIPDYTLTRLRSCASFHTYFQSEILSGKHARYNEREPNAIHLSDSAFSSTNIHVVPEVKTRDRKKKLSLLLAEAAARERDAAQKALQSARSEGL